jgi:hypothetical protein
MNALFLLHLSGHHPSETTKTASVLLRNGALRGSWRGSTTKTASGLLRNGALARYIHCFNFDDDSMTYDYDNVANLTLARSDLKQCMQNYLLPRERPTTYVSTTTSLQTYRNRGVGILLPPSKAGCAYIRDSWTRRTLHSCTASDDVFIEYARDVTEKLERNFTPANVRKYWLSNTSIRCCLTLPRALQLRSRLVPARWLSGALSGENQVQAWVALNESIGLFCRSNCKTWASLVGSVFTELTGRRLAVEVF